MLANDNFVIALENTRQTTLFSKTETRVLVCLCVLAFSLPLVAGVVLIKTFSKPIALSSKSNEIAELPSSIINTNNDEQAMAKIFLNKASNASSLAQRQQFISEAQALSALNPTVNKQIIAAPAETTIIASTAATIKSNSTSNTVTLKSGTSKQFIAYTGLKADSQIYLTPTDNRANVVIYVATRETGKGFTLESLSPLTQDVTLTWYEIKPQ